MLNGTGRKEDSPKMLKLNNNDRIYLDLELLKYNTLVVTRYATEMSKDGKDAGWRQKNNQRFGNTL